MKCRFAQWCFCAALVGGAASASPGPERVVSLDYCADQYVLRFLPESKILAVSPDATRSFSYLKEQARGVPQVRPTAEDVLTLNPDLVVRSYGGGPHTLPFFSRAGVEVLQIPYANNIEDIRDTTKMVARLLGAALAGETLVKQIDQRLAALHTRADLSTALYMTPTGVTSGPGTLVHEMLAAAGLVNFERRTGWYSLPLERLAYEQPDMIAAAFFDNKTNHPHRWSAMRHPVARTQVSDLPTTMLQGAWTACGAWFLVDAIEALADP